MGEAITLEMAAAQLQDPMRKGLVLKITHESVFFSLLRFILIDGMSYEYGEQASLPGISFRSLNGSYTTEAGIINPKKEHMAIFGGKLKVDWQLEGTAVHTNSVSAAIRAAGLFYDYMVINGNPAADVKQFWGLKARLAEGQIIYAGANGGALTFNLMDELLDSVAGPNEKKVLILNKWTKRAYRNLLRAATGQTSTEMVGPLPSYDGAKIVVLDEDDEETPILPRTESRGTSNNCTSMYCIRPGEDAEGEYVQGLARKDLVRHKPLAQTDTNVSDLVEMFGGLGVFHGRAAARLAGLK